MDPAIQATIQAAFANHPHAPIAIYVFGSVARGTTAATSDIDIAILYADRAPSTLNDQPFDIADDLSGELKRPVDIVILNSASPDLIHRILRDGILIADSNPSARIQFEVRSRNEYFDIKPHLDRYRRAR